MSSSDRPEANTTSWERVITHAFFVPTVDNSLIQTYSRSVIFMAIDFFMSRNPAATKRLTEPSPGPLLSEADELFGTRAIETPFLSTQTDLIADKMKKTCSIPVFLAENNVFHSISLSPERGTN